jgi:hypothetical protein
LSQWRPRGRRRSHAASRGRSREAGRTRRSERLRSLRTFKMATSAALWCVSIAQWNQRQHPPAELGGEHANGNDCQDVIYPGDRMGEGIISPLASQCPACASAAAGARTKAAANVVGIARLMIILLPPRGRDSSGLAEGGLRYIKSSPTISVNNQRRRHRSQRNFRADNLRRYIRPRRLVHQGDSDRRLGRTLIDTSSRGPPNVSSCRCTVPVQAATAKRRDGEARCMSMNNSERN